MKKSDNSYDEEEHRKELVTEGMNMPKENNSLSKEEIFYSAPHLEVGRKYRKEEGVIKETPGSLTSKTSEQCKKIDEEDAKYIVPEMDLTYSLRDEEDKEQVINVMPRSVWINSYIEQDKKNPLYAKLDDFYGQSKSVG
jgi:hypothetical protein